ncbi:MAG: hypothetical protein KJ015_38130 [Myxococcales bacterium]|nr:hypothetical protein [Myxococcales bacterium]
MSKRVGSQATGASRRQNYDDRFDEHRSAHPELLELLIAHARAAKRSGRNRTSMRELWETVRGAHPELGGLNDNFHSRYARLIMAAAPDLSGMFRTRRLRTAEDVMVVRRVSAAARGKRSGA